MSKYIVYILLLSFFGYGCSAKSENQAAKDEAQAEALEQLVEKAKFFGLEDQLMAAFRAGEPA